MNLPLVIGFYGYSDSGKTTILQSVIDYFSKDGFKIAALKITPHDFSLDTPGKDTWKFSQSGAKLVAFNTALENSIIYKEQLPIIKVIDLIASIDDFDIIFVEGSMNASYPQIRVGLKKPLQEHTVFTYDGDINKLISFIKHQIRRSETMGQSIELKVNGKKIPLTEFPKDFIKNTIVGMISSLKGIEEIDEISLSISLKKQTSSDE